MRGDCLSCSRLPRCMETSVTKVLEDYTCVMYESVEEPIYRARVDTMKKFGDAQAIISILNNGEEYE